MELQLLAAAIRRHAVLISALAVLCLLVGVAATRTLVGDYRAEATLLLDPNAVVTPQQRQFTGDPERFVDGQLGLLTSAPISERAAASLPGLKGPEVREAISLEHVTGSDLVTVVVEDPSAEAARDIANSVATAYVDLRREATQEAVEAQLTSVGERVAEVEAELLAIPVASQDSARAQVLLRQYEVLLDQRSALAAPGVTQDATAVLDPAATPRSPTTLPLLPTLLASLVGGAALGLVLALVREARTPHVASAGGIERMLGARVRAVLPRVRRRERGRSRADVVPRTVDALRPLVPMIVSSGPGEQGRVVAICSVESGVDTASAGRSLAVAAATVGHRVALLVATRPTHGGPRASREEDAQLRPVVPGPTDTGPEALQAHGASRIPRRTALAEPGVPSTGLRPEAGLAGVDVFSRPETERPEDFERTVFDLLARYEVVVLDVAALLSSAASADVVTWATDVVVVVPVPDQRARELRLAGELLSRGTARIHPVLSKDRPSRHVDVA